MNERLDYHTVETLRALSLAELNALWELVPTDRQRRYRTVYEREVRSAGASGSDTLEKQVISALLDRYQANALVPIGPRWAKTPARIQQAVQNAEPLIPPEAEHETAPSNKAQALFIAGGAALFLLFLALLLISRSRNNEPEQIVHTDSTPVVVTPTPRYTPTPTPIALEDQDVIIRDGVRDRPPAYPVNLQILPAGQSQPRVFVVQRRRVELSEWQYDPNPDTASFIAGLSVRPVIGIPWSRQNEVLFEGLGPGSTFSVRMNTGAALYYEFANRSDVHRSETDAFRQVEPGLVLVLIGETDQDGAPTGTRILITAAYPPDQELSREGALAESVDLPELPITPTPPMPTVTPLPARDLLYVEVISITSQDGSVTVQLRLYNGQPEAVPLGPEDFAIAFGYAPQPPGPWTTAEGLEPFTLLPGQAVDLTLIWVRNSEPYAALQVGIYRYTLQLK